MPSITVNIDTKSLRDQAKRFRIAPRYVEIALVRAVNRGGDAALVKVRAELVQRTGIRDKDTRRSKGLTRKLATKHDPRYVIKARSKWTPLSYFQPEQQPDGVRAAPWNRQQTFKGTFMLRFGTGYVGVFKRVSEGARKTYTHRGSGKQYKAKPIKELWGPSLAVELTRGTVPLVFEKVARERTAARLPHEIAFALSQIGGRAARTAA